MNKGKVLSSILILLLSFSLLCYLNVGIPVAHAQLATYPIVLPFSTGFEPVASQGKGRTNFVDWKTNDFYGYSGSSGSQPECGVVPTEVQLPDPAPFNFSFGVRQLRVRGWFGGSYSYCYFDLFDQSADCDYQTPFQLQPQTFISVWYYHSQLTDCMIDGEIYNVRTGQVWTLRDFNYQSKYIVDQNNVRLHPACRSNDNLNCWNYSCFDLSQIWNSDPGNWWVDKIWIGFDNGNDHKTGQARTYFDDLTICYGVSSTGGKQHVEFKNILGQTLSATDAQVSGSAVPWYWNGPDNKGNYHLYVKVMDSGWVSNPVDTGLAWLIGNIYWSPYYLMVNCGQNSYGVNTVARSDMDIVEVNLTLGNNKDTGVSNVVQYVWDCFDVAAGILCPEFTVVDVTLLAAQGAALFFKSGNTNTYLYKWSQANNYFASGYPYPSPSNVIKSDFGEVMLDIPVPPSSRNFQIPITIYTDVYCCHDGTGSYSWDWIATLSKTLYLPWTTPDIDPRPAGGLPIVGFAKPAPAGSFGVSHVGNPNGNDCNMQVNIAGQGTAAWVPTGVTIPISYSGYIWAQPASPGNIMYAVVGIGNTALSASPANGGRTCPGVYPGLPFSVNFNLNVGPYTPGTYNFYGVAAAQYTAADAMTYYNNNPGARFLLGTMTLYAASTGIGQIHGPTFTVSACVSAPLPYLLKTQTLNGYSGYVFTELTNAAGSVVISWQSMTCTATVTQAAEDGGNFTYSYNLATLPINQYYGLWFTATATDGQSQTSSIKIYYN